MTFVKGQTVYFDDYLSRLLNGAKEGKVVTWDICHEKIKIELTNNSIPSIWIEGKQNKHLSLEPLTFSTTYEPYEYILTPDNPIPIDIQMGVKGKNLLDGGIVEITEKEPIYEQDIEREEEKEMDYKTLLKKWAELKREQLKETYKEEGNQLLENDPVVKDFEDTHNCLKAIVEEYYKRHEVPTDTFAITTASKKRIAQESTKQKLKDLETAFYHDDRVIDNTVSEIYAAVAICQTEESLRKVLRAYDVIDKNGKISVK